MNMNFFSNKLRFVAIFFALFAITAVFGATDSFAVTKTWTGGGSDDNFNTAGNWSPSGAPSDGDDLVFSANDITSSPRNNIANLEIGSITINDGTIGQLRAIYFDQPTSLAGDVKNLGEASLHLNGGFSLDAAVTIDGFSIFSTSGAGTATNTIALAGNELTITYDETTVAVNIPITGNGVVNYDRIGILQLGATNTYSGTTTFSSVGRASNTTSEPRVPTEMFGSSAVEIDSSSSVWLQFSASGTLSNQIMLSDTEVNGSQFNPQLYVQDSGGASNLNIALSGIILNGTGGIGVTSPVASVNLAGIQANGNCLYVQTIYQNKFQNAPTFCGASGSTSGSSVKVPGVPNTGDKAPGSARGTVALSIFAGATALLGLLYAARKINLFGR